MEVDCDVDFLFDEYLGDLLFETWRQCFGVIHEVDPGNGNVLPKEWMARAAYLHDTAVLHPGFVRICHDLFEDVIFTPAGEVTALVAEGLQAYSRAGAESGLVHG